MPARLTVLLIAALAIAAAAFAGCGDGDEGSADDGSGIASSSLDRDEYVKQASKACREEKEDILERVLAYTSKHEKPNQTRAEEAALFAKMTKAVVLPTIRREIAALEKLGAPSGDEEEIEGFIEAERKAMRSIANLGSVASRFQLERYFAESAELAREYGIGACANA